MLLKFTTREQRAPSTQLVHSRLARLDVTPEGVARQRLVTETPPAIGL
jgi:hypothetical protein